MENFEKEQHRVFEEVTGKVGASWLLSKRQRSIKSHEELDDTNNKTQERNHRRPCSALHPSSPEIRRPDRAS